MRKSKGMTLIEVLIFTSVSGLAVLLIMDLFKIYNTAANNMTQRASLNTLARSIVGQHDCCATIRKFFQSQATAVPAPPLTAANFAATGGVMSLYNKFDQDINAAITPWQTRGFVTGGDTSITVQMKHSIPNQNYMGRDLSSAWMGRNDFTTDGPLLICPLVAVDYRPSQDNCSCRKKAFMCDNVGQNCDCDVTGNCSCLAIGVSACPALCPRGLVCNCNPGPCACGPGV